jgi:putative MATE family efflux protein
MKRIWRILMQALSGAPRDYTQGSISKAVILLGIPMVVEMAMESVFAVTDIFFTGRLGANAIATIGLTESLLTLVYTVAFGLSIGAMAMVSRRIGEQDPEGAANSAVQVLLLGIFISTLVGIIGVSFAPQLLALMGGSAELVAYATPYMRVMFSGNIVILCLFLGNAIFRGAGDGAIAMRALAIANALNVLLAPCLVFGLLFFPKLGVTGAACATTIARGIGALYSLSHLVWGQGRVKTRAQHWKIHPDLMWKVIKLSASGTFQIFIATASWVGLVRVVSSFGSQAVAGYTIGIRVMLFALFPAFGLSNAAATMVGQSLGAKNPDRAEKAVWIAGLYNLGFLGVMGLIFLIFAPVIIGWFTKDAQVYAYAVACLRTVTCGFLFYAFGLVTSQSFNGAGDTWTPTWINFVVFWVFEIPAAYIFSSVLKMGPQGVFLSVTLAFSALAIISAVIFRQGRWKTQRI